MARLGLNRKQALWTALLVLWVTGTPLVMAEQYQSRLGQMLANKASVYLPSRLVLGETGKFVVKAKAGTQVELFMSAKSEGLVLPNGLALQVGADAEKLSGVVPENGVLELSLPIPNEPDWEGQVLYVDVAVGQASDMSDFTHPDLISASGRRAEANALVITKQAAGSNTPMILPSMPGFSPQAFQQLTNMGEIYSKEDDSRKQLMDNGQIDRSVELERNSLIKRGAFQQGVK